MDINRENTLTTEAAQAIDAMFEYHPMSEEKQARGLLVRKAAADLIKVIVANIPPSPDRTVAIRKIRESRMDCMSALTFDGRY